MERSGNLPIDPASDITVGDVRSYHRLEVRCRLCKRRSVIDPMILRTRFKDSQRLVELQNKLRCANCGNRDGNQFALRAHSRD
jgi:hypothetical protein